MPMNLSSILPTYSNNEIMCKNFLWIKKAHISLKRKTSNCKNRKIHQTHPSLQDSRMVSWCRGQCYIIFFSRNALHIYTHRVAILIFLHSPFSFNHTHNWNSTVLGGEVSGSEDIEQRSMYRPICCSITSRHTDVVVNPRAISSCRYHPTTMLSSSLPRK